MTFEQISLFAEAPPSSVVAFDPPTAAGFIPKVMARAPAEIRSLPENTDAERISKAKAVLKWLMATYRTAFSFSGGKTVAARWVLQ